MWTVVLRADYLRKTDISFSIIVFVHNEGFWFCFCHSPLRWRCSRLILITYTSECFPLYHLPDSSICDVRLSQ